MFFAVKFSALALAATTGAVVAVVSYKIGKHNGEVGLAEAVDQELNNHHVPFAHLRAANK